ncbi:MAG TPA: zf-HC2 domain-containing protein [Chloroflexota bacterium]|nr:zf-HC2 domain-containing protein [Chloroflexota bacterium]
MAVVPEHAELNEHLNAYLDGALEHALRERVEAHLRLCERCRTELEELRVTKATLRALPQLRAPRPFTVPVPASPDRPRGPVPAARPAGAPLPWLSWVWRLGSLGAAACLLLAIVVGTLPTQTSGTVSPPAPLAAQTDTRAVAPQAPGAAPQAPSGPGAGGATAPVSSPPTGPVAASAPSRSQGDQSDQSAQGGQAGQGPQGSRASQPGQESVAPRDESAAPGPAHQAPAVGSPAGASSPFGFGASEAARESRPAPGGVSAPMLWLGFAIVLALVSAAAFGLDRWGKTRVERARP